MCKLPGVPPPRATLRAFEPSGASERGLELLPGGMGRTWRCGELILKPVDNVDETNWVSETLSRLPSRSQLFRRSEPVASTDGEWIVDGWCAQRSLPGTSSESSHNHWKDMLSAAKSLHEALKGLCLSPPSFIQERSHPWAKADRLVWLDGPITPQVEPELSDLVSAFLLKRMPLSRPLLDSSQIVHGDIAGNVLFEAGSPPAIIDFTPYWHPPAFADAMIVIDGLLWFNAPTELLKTASSGDLDDWKGLLVRAFLFRAITLDYIIKELRDGDTQNEVEWLHDGLECFRRVAQLLEEHFAW